MAKMSPDILTHLPHCARLDERFFAYSYSLRTNLFRTLYSLDPRKDQLELLLLERFEGSLVS